MNLDSVPHEVACEALAMAHARWVQATTEQMQQQASGPYLQMGMPVYTTLGNAWVLPNGTLVLPAEAPAGHAPSFPIFQVGASVQQQQQQPCSHPIPVALANEETVCFHPPREQQPPPPPPVVEEEEISLSCLNTPQNSIEDFATGAPTTPIFEELLWDDMMHLRTPPPSVPVPPPPLMLSEELMDAFPSRRDAMISAGFGPYFIHLQAPEEDLDDLSPEPTPTLPEPISSSSSSLENTPNVPSVAASTSEEESETDVEDAEEDESPVPSEDEREREECAQATVAHFAETAYRRNTRIYLASRSNKDADPLRNIPMGNTMHLGDRRVKYIALHHDAIATDMGRSPLSSWTVLVDGAVRDLMSKRQRRRPRAKGRDEQRPADSTYLVCMWGLSVEAVLRHVNLRLRVSHRNALSHYNVLFDCLENDDQCRLPVLRYTHRETRRRLHILVAPAVATPTGR